jgi:hypothetical protein
MDHISEAYKLPWFHVSMSLGKASTKLIELKPQVGTDLYSELQ